MEPRPHDDRKDRDPREPYYEGDDGHEPGDGVAALPCFPHGPSTASFCAKAHSLHLFGDSEGLDERRDEQVGIGADDLPAILREEYLYAIELARAKHNPSTNWEAFRYYLWEALVGVFGVASA